MLNNGEDGHWAVLDGHLDGEAFAGFAVVDGHWNQSDTTLGNGKVGGAIVAEVNNIVCKISEVKLGEGTANTEEVHDLHGLHVLDLILTGDGDVAPREQGVTGDDGGNDVLILTTALIVIGHGAELVFLNQTIEGDGSLCRALELGLLTLFRNVELLLELFDLSGDILVTDGLAQVGEFTHFDDLKVVAEGGGLLGEV